MFITNKKLKFLIIKKRDSEIFLGIRKGRSSALGFVLFTYTSAFRHVSALLFSSDSFFFYCYSFQTFSLSPLATNN